MSLSVTETAEAQSSDAEFYREHGYTLVGAFRVWRVGELIPANHPGWQARNFAAGIPWRVVAITTSTEFKRWHQTVYGRVSHAADLSYAKFYRIEACD